MSKSKPEIAEVVRTVRFTVDVYDRVVRLARASDRTAIAEIRRAVREYVERAEAEQSAASVAR